MDEIATPMTDAGRVPNLDPVVPRCRGNCRESRGGNGRGRLAVPPEAPRRKVLIVEDEPCSRAAMGVLCRLFGLETHAATTLGEGLAMLDLPPDFVILDLVLPDGSGLELLRRVRTENRPVRVAVVTAVSCGPELEAVRALSPDRLLFKPVDFPQLRDWMTAPSAATVAAAAAR
jgi:CheY-like chemotaxis protein